MITQFYPIIAFIYLAKTPGRHILQTAKRLKVAIPSLKTMDPNFPERGDKTRGFSTVNVLRPLKIFIMTNSEGFSRHLSVCQSFDYYPGSNV